MTSNISPSTCHISDNKNKSLTACKRDLEKIRDILQPQIDRNIAGRVLNSVGDGDDILRCKELVVQAINRFQVSTTLNIMRHLTIFEVYTFIALRLKAIDSRRGHHDESRNTVSHCYFTRAPFQGLRFSVSIQTKYQLGKIGRIPSFKI